MSLFDNVVSSIMAGSSPQASSLQGVLGSLLGGSQHSENGATPGATGAPDNPQTGSVGIAHLVQLFESAGLGPIIQSWIARGANLPVSPDQLNSALGVDRVQSMSAQSGLAPDDLLREMSHVLPMLINQLTPTGEVPQQILATKNANMPVDGDIAAYQS